MGIESEDVVHPANAEEACGEKVNHTGDPLVEIHSVNTKRTCQQEQDPSDVVVVKSFRKPAIGLSVHTRNQEKIDDPSNTQKTKCQSPQNSRKRFTIVKSVRSHEAKKPKDIAEDDTVGSAASLVDHSDHGSIWFWSLQVWPRGIVLRRVELGAKAAVSDGSRVGA